MKKSISYLPETKQQELNTIVNYIKEQVSTCEMIILYGSYARNKYVDYDQRTEYGVRTFFMSDFDILVITRRDKKITNHTVSRLLQKIVTQYASGENIGFRTPVHIINDTIENINKQIKDGRYFFTDLKKQGVMLYDSGKYELSPIIKLNYTQILNLSKQYYKNKYKTAVEFLYDAKINVPIKRYVHASFCLHQAVENMLFGMVLVYTLYSPKEHNLYQLLSNIKCHNHKPVTVFKQETEEQIRLFKLLADAYVQARYNDKFVVTKQDIEALIPNVEKLKNVMKEVCKERIDEYKLLAANEQASTPNK